MEVRVQGRRFVQVVIHGGSLNRALGVRGNHFVRQLEGVQTLS